MFSFTQLGLLLFMVFLFFLPPILVLASNRTIGGAKFGWFLLTVCLSWIGYLAFILITDKVVEE